MILLVAVHMYVDIYLDWIKAVIFSSNITFYFYVKGVVNISLRFMKKNISAVLLVEMREDTQNDHWG